VRFWDRQRKMSKAQGLRPARPCLYSAWTGRCGHLARTKNPDILLSGFSFRFASLGTRPTFCTIHTLHQRMNLNRDDEIIIKTDVKPQRRHDERWGKCGHLPPTKPMETALQELDLGSKPGMTKEGFPDGSEDPPFKVQDLRPGKTKSHKDGRSALHFIQGLRQDLTYIRIKLSVLFADEFFDLGDAAL